MFCIAVEVGNLLQEVEGILSSIETDCLNSHQYIHPEDDEAVKLAGLMSH